MVCTPTAHSFGFITLLEDRLGLLRRDTPKDTLRREDAKRIVWFDAIVEVG
jgi:hypothetical protein